jgi:hypothetical protein|tara:strand:+ start:196 stop:603 length:408 start_codon:yes stop_codon:yes gene_type:complete
MKKFSEDTITTKDGQSYTIFQVKMSRFGDGKMRTVVIPTEELKGTAKSDLDKIYHYGQNDFAIVEQKLPSVSVGDIIQYDEALHIVRNSGFEELKGETGRIIMDAQAHVEDNIEYQKALYAGLKDIDEKLYFEIC